MFQPLLTAVAQFGALESELLLGDMCVEAGVCGDMCVCVEAWGRVHGLSLEPLTSTCGVILLGDHRWSRDKDLNIIKSHHEKVIMRNFQFLSQPF